MQRVNSQRQPAEQDRGNGSSAIAVSVPVHAPSDSAPSDGTRDSLRELTALETECATLADRLSAAVRELQSGRGPGAGLAAEVEACHVRFGVLRKHVVRMAESAGVSAGPTTEDSATLEDLRAVLNAVAFRETLDRALEELAPVALLCHDRTTLTSLTECKAKAAQLMDDISQSEWPRLHPECQPLLERRHPYSRLLDLVRQGEQLSDEAWQEAEETVGATFGKELAVAAARGRLRFQSEASNARKTTECCPKCGSELDTGSLFCGECGSRRE